MERCQSRSSQQYVTLLRHLSIYGLYRPFSPIVTNEGFHETSEHIRRLGNSSGTAFAAWEAFFIGTEGGNHRNDGILKLPAEGDIKNRLKKRHRDPEDISKTKYTDTALRTRGVWKKLQVEKGNGVPPSRKGFATVVRKGIDHQSHMRHPFS